MRKLRFGDAVVLVVIVVVAIVLLFTFSPTLSRLVTGRARMQDVPVSEIRSRLESLEVRGWVDVPKYERAHFGPAWADEDANGCDTRNDVLARDLNAVAYRDTPINCVVDRGVLTDPYTAEKIQFKRGTSTSEMVQIDHVVALADAWYSGAWQWDPAHQQQFANDPRNLLAVSGAANQEKGHLRADQWLPKNKAYHCSYVARQVWVKSQWQLSVTSSERQTMINVLADCPVVEVAK